MRHTGWRWRNISIGHGLAVVLVVGIGLVAGVRFDTRFLHRIGLAPEIQGIPRIIDGDSLAFGDTHVRLKGIDAPETRQVCQKDGAPWRCGVDAREALRALLDGEVVTCRDRGLDRNRRVLATCTTGRTGDIGEAMVRDGWAVSYDDSYTWTERSARLARRGLWAGEFERPRDWRRVHRGDLDE